MGKILSIDNFNQEKHIFKYNGQIFKNIFKLIFFSFHTRKCHIDLFSYIISKAICLQN